MAAASSHSTEFTDPQQGTIQRYLLRTAPTDPRTTKDKMAPGRTAGKTKPPPTASAAICTLEDNNERFQDHRGEPSASSVRSVTTPDTHTGASQTGTLPLQGEPTRTEATALLSAFRMDFESWASKMEDSLHVELNALRQKVTANEEVVSVLTTAQDDHEARITALESSSATHLRRLCQQQLRIEDCENRSCRNNIRLQGIPEATSGTELKPTVITILNKVLGREAASPIELDRVHRVGGPGGARDGRPPRCSVGSTTTP